MFKRAVVEMRLKELDAVVSQLNKYREWIGWKSQSKELECIGVAQVIS